MKMDDSEFQQICIACNKKHLLSETSCECGHVLREAVSLQKEISRKRRAPHRPNSVSSEFIGKSINQSIKEASKKARYCAELDSIKEHKMTLKRKQNERKLKSKTKVLHNAHHENKKLNPIFDDSIKQQRKELLNLIESSYKNIYFNRCKSYRKVKLTDFDFEFDFTTFETNAPYYPTALEDINSKINRTTAFRQIVDNR